MSKLIGTNPNQVPSNADLGTAAFMDKKDFLLSKGSSLSAINTVLPKTAVDVFVYDTSKDSDGGAWRKRCQHLSWYNEELNTTTRGSRREFPSIAILVATESTLTIYDGDSPNLEMWMIFEGEYRQMLYASTVYEMQNVVALNGWIVTSAYENGGTAGSLTLINFIEDRGYKSRAGYGTHPVNISRRNEYHNPIGDSRFTALNTSLTRWVDMTVHSVSDIYAPTGLPMPAIAVCSSIGVSVYMRGAWRAVPSENASIGRLGFMDSNTLAYGHRGGASYDFVTTRLTDLSVRNYYGFYISTNNVPWLGINGSSAVGLGDGRLYAYGPASGINILQEDFDDKLNGMACLIKTAYNTGWLHGDTKLSVSEIAKDKPDSIIRGEEFVVNGTFNTDVSGWTIENGTFVRTASATGLLTYGSGNAYASQTVGSSFITVGKKYILSINVKSYSGQVGLSSTSSWGSKTMTRVGTHLFPITATADYLVIKIYSSTSGGYLEVDDISLMPEESYLANRSKASNYAIKTVGELKRTPVASGAELMCYSGFTTSDYLEVATDPIFQIGSNNAHSMCWFKADNLTNEGMLIGFEGDGYGTSFNLRTESDGKVTGWVGVNAFTPYASVASLPKYEDKNWHHAAWVKSGNQYTLYVDGEIVDSITFDYDLTFSGSNERIRIGDRAGAAPSAFNGSIALPRFGLSAPSAKQIRQIYSEESAMFDENAKVSLYGTTTNSTRAVAFDKDENLLHVGSDETRSTFSGICRVDESSTPVTKSISAAKGFVVEE